MRFRVSGGLQISGQKKIHIDGCPIHVINGVATPISRVKTQSPIHKAIKDPRTPYITGRGPSCMINWSPCLQVGSAISTATRDVRRREDGKELWRGDDEPTKEAPLFCYTRRKEPQKYPPKGKGETSNSKFTNFWASKC